LELTVSCETPSAVLSVIANGSHTDTTRGISPHGAPFQSARGMRCARIPPLLQGLTVHDRPDVTGLAVDAPGREAGMMRRTR
jgi:hypothetical protein